MIFSSRVNTNSTGLSKTFLCTKKYKWIWIHFWEYCFLHFSLKIVNIYIFSSNCSIYTLISLCCHGQLWDLKGNVQDTGTTTVPEAEQRQPLQHLVFLIHVHWAEEASLPFQLGMELYIKKLKLLLDFEIVQNIHFKI